MVGKKPASMTVLPKKGMFHSRAKSMVTILAMTNVLRRKKKYRTNMKPNKKHKKKSKIIVEDFDSKKVMAVTNLLIDTPSDVANKEKNIENDSKEVLEISDEANIIPSSDDDIVIMDE